MKNNAPLVSFNVKRELLVDAVDWVKLLYRTFDAFAKAIINSNKVICQYFLFVIIIIIIIIIIIFCLEYPSRYFAFVNVLSDVSSIIYYRFFEIFF
jgi:hypothetical protein